MRAELRVADSNGQIIDAGRAGGVGFRLVPAVGHDSAAALRPGSFPVRVKFYGSSRPALTIVNSDVKYFAKPHEGFTVEGLESGDSWLVEEYFERSEGTIPAGSKLARTFRVQAATAVPTAAPTLATDGYKIRSGTLRHHFYFSGAGVGTVTARVWVRTKGGTWVDGGTDSVMDPASGPIFTRFQYAQGDRIYLQASAVNLSVEIDADQEMG